MATRLGILMMVAQAQVQAYQGHNKRLGIFIIKKKISGPGHRKSDLLLLAANHLLTTLDIGHAVELS